MKKILIVITLFTSYSIFASQDYSQRALVRCYTSNGTKIFDGIITHLSTEWAAPGRSSTVKKVIGVKEMTNHVVKFICPNLYLEELKDIPN